MNQHVTISTSKIFLFDVDGTLTPAREKMTDGFYSFFQKWARDKTVYLVSGSDYEKLQEQLPLSLLESLSGIFCCMGSVLYVEGKLIHKHDFDPPPELINYLHDCLASSSYDVRTGNHLERRIGMLNFSIVGRNSTLKQRKTYHNHDALVKERETIANYINDDANFKDIGATVGGEISIDIYPIGLDKSQVLRYIKGREYIFFGDKIFPGGNDYALGHALEKHNSTLHCVKDYNETLELIKEKYV